MRQLIFIFMGLSIMVCTVYAQSAVVSDIPRINARVAYAKFMKGDIILVDAMPEATYRKYHILGAINLPNDGPEDLARVDAADLQIPFNKGILVYCD
jgi:rhodanese-related sulfurtransferase